MSAHIPLSATPAVLRIACVPILLWVPLVLSAEVDILRKTGLGTQQVEDALIQLLPDNVEVIRMDADSTRGKDAHKELLERFDAAECAVLLGTQMIAKGLDFPEVTLAAVVNADYALKMPDFRASERAFDLYEQLAGRAGQGRAGGPRDYPDLFAGRSGDSRRGDA